MEIQRHVGKLLLHSRGTVIKSITGAVLPLFHTLFENFVFFPEVQCFTFPIYKIEICWHFLVHDYGCLSICIFCCCRIIKRKSPLPQGKGEPLQNHLHTVICAQGNGWAPARVTLFTLRLKSDVHKKGRCRACTVPGSLFPADFFATVSVKAFIIYLCRKYSTARDLCQGGDLIGIVCDSKAHQSKGTSAWGDCYTIVCRIINSIVLLDNPSDSLGSEPPPLAQGRHRWRICRGMTATEKM